jgi:hypothetical protein
MRSLKTLNTNNFDSMQKIYLLIFMLLLVGSTPVTYSQSSAVPAAAFDVMVLNNGEIIYGKVVEVGQHLVRYKRTDIPDGPIYELLKSDIYAISYRNQLTEYMEAPASGPLGLRKGNYIDDTGILRDSVDGTWYAAVRKGEIRLGFGFIRNFSRVKEVDEYQSEFTFPSVHFSYLFPVGPNMDLGLAMGFAGFEYADKSFSEYDQLMTDRSIHESLFSIAVVGKYGIDMELIRPYFLTGVSFTNSSVRTEGSVTFTDDERSILVRGGSRSGQFGVPIRGGVDVRITEAFSAFIEVGTGLSLMQVGGVFKIGK